VLGDPLINPNTGDNLSRTETGVALTYATTIYADQTNKIDWGKVEYAPGENGGISGVAVYATTRAEDDPQQAATDAWEPGIPRVQFNLYADFDADGVIDDADGNGVIQLADVDNYPFGWADGGPPGSEDIDRNGNGAFNRGDALNIATSDSWDDNMPTGCQGPVQSVFGQPIRDCSETLQTWNTVRPGVFDGGWAFDVQYPFGPGLFRNPDAEIPLPGNKYYIVEAIPPPGLYAEPPAHSAPVRGHACEQAAGTCGAAVPDTLSKRPDPCLQGRRDHASLHHEADPAFRWAERGRRLPPLYGGA
jgi:hypothetical protein